MWYTYCLISIKNKKLYIGYTENLKRRVTEHNRKKGGAYTSHNAPFKLIYYEAFINKKEATQQEKFYKSGYGKEVLKDKIYLTLEYFKK
jgi:putative endonuclease